MKNALNVTELTGLQKLTQEQPAHRRHVLVLQCRFGNQLLQPCLQDGPYALGHPGARFEDSQRCLSADASHPGFVLGMLRQADAPPKHPQPTFRLSHCRWRQDVPHSRQKHHHRGLVPRHQEMA